MDRRLPKKILGMGNALVDIMTRIDDDQILERFKLPKGSMTLIDREMANCIQMQSAGFPKSKASGGSAANTIHGLARLGAETAFIGKVGNDDLGHFFRRDMEETGIRPILYNSINDTGRAMALVSPDSERTFGTFLGAAVELDHEDITSDVFKGFDAFYIEGYLVSNKRLFDKAMRLASKHKILTCLDLASYNIVTQYRDEFRSYLKGQTDIVFANEEEAKALTGKDAEEAVKELSEMVKVAVVKLGSRGSLVMSGEKLVHIPARKVKSIDTTGAGDLYSAGFLCGYLNELPLVKCGELGTFLASKVITSIGAKIPDSEWAGVLLEAERIKNA